MHSPHIRTNGSWDVISIASFSICEKLQRDVQLGMGHMTTMLPQLMPTLNPIKWSTEVNGKHVPIYPLLMVQQLGVVLFRSIYRYRVVPQMHADTRG